MWLLLAFAIYAAIQCLYLNIIFVIPRIDKTGHTLVNSAAWDIITALSWALYITYA